MIMRPYQEKAVTDALDALGRHGNALVVAPTGAGKTVMMAELVRRMGGKTLVLQHRKELVGQNMKTFRAVDPDVRCSLWTASTKSFGGDVTFAMVQSLAGHVDAIPKVDTVVVDEAHHAAADTWLRIIDAARAVNPGLKVAGFTATPSRSDRRALRRVFGHVCNRITTGMLVRQGFLVPPRTFVVDIDGHIGRLQEMFRTKAISASEFGEQLDVAAAMAGQPFMESVVRNWQERAGDRRTVVFAPTVDYARQLADVFTASGIPAGCVYGEMPDSARASILGDMAKGALRVVTNCMVLTEGWDYPPVSCVVLLRHCSEKATMIQMVGRGLRPVRADEYPGIVKADCLVLDFGASLLANRSLDADVALDAAGGDTPGDAPVRVCPACGAASALGAKRCWYCGFVFPKAVAEPKDVTLSEVSFASDGELFAASPWQYVDLFGDDRALVATGMEAWAGVFTAKAGGPVYHAFGRIGRHKPVLLMVGPYLQALAAADDFMRRNEPQTVSTKNRRWLRFPASARQMDYLHRKYHYRLDVPLTRYEASAHISFRAAQKQVEQAMGLQA